MVRSVIGVALSLLLATSSSAQQRAGGPAGEPVRGLTASAEIFNAEGHRIGTAELVQTPTDAVLIRLRVEGIAAGAHGFHIHETGQCSPADFSSAGGHYAPRGRGHGVMHPHGAHGGDLLNLHVPESGRVDTERLAPGVSLVPGATGFLLDDDGSALIIHGGPDDYRSQPSGDAGPRLACGVIR